jgi:hypothetical protein
VLSWQVVQHCCSAAAVPCPGMVLGPFVQKHMFWPAVGPHAWRHMLQQARLCRAPHLVLDREVDEVGIHQHLVGWAQLRVVFEEQRCRRLLYVPHFLLLGLLLLWWPNVTGLM